MIHGPNNKGNLNLLYQLINKRIPYPLGAFKNKRSFLFIENLCYIIHELIKKQPVSGIFNVCDDDALSTNKLVEIISKVTNKKALILGVSGQDGAFLAKFLVKKNYEVYGTTRDLNKYNLKKLAFLGIVEKINLHQLEPIDAKS